MSQAGFARAVLPLPEEPRDMAGYGPMAQQGRPGTDDLQARVLYLEADGERVALVALDLMSGSAALHELVGERLPWLGRSRLILAGTHTHTAPGRFYGNPFYDALTIRPRLRRSRWRFDRSWAEALATTIAGAVERARDDAAPAVVGVGIAACWGVGANRSLPAFAKNAEAEADHWPPPSWNLPAPGGLHAMRRAVDPRVVAIAAFAGDGELVGAFGTFGCHATALGVEQSTYDRDWPGRAVDGVAERLGTDRLALALGGAGDVSPLSPEALERDDDPTEDQGPELAAGRAAAVADALVEAVTEAHAKAEALSLGVGAAVWAPPVEHPLGGLPLLGGAEDARSRMSAMLREGLRRSSVDPEEPHSPKLRQPLPRFVRRLCHDAPVHRLHRVRIGRHALFTFPGEPTAAAGARAGAALIDADEAIETASPIGYVNDYAGYFTTREEYLAQHYEGASTMYGRETLQTVIRDLRLAGTGSAEETAAPIDALDEAAYEKAMDELRAALTGAKALLLDDDAASPQLLFADRGEGAAGPPLFVADGQEVAGVTLPIEGPDGEPLMLAVFPALDRGSVKELAPTERSLRWRSETLEIVSS